MVLVLFLLFTIILIIILTIISTIKITIENLEVSNKEQKTPNLQKINIKIGLYLFGKIRIYEKKINKRNLKKMQNSKQIKKIKNQIKQKNKTTKKLTSLKESKNIIKKLNLEIKLLNLNLEIGTENVILTSFLTTIISTIISIILAKNINEYNEKNYQYNIIPKYNNKNSIKLDLKGILQIKLVNIINIIYIIYKDRSGIKNERTSNRKSYDNSNEQHSRYDRCKYNYR